MIQYCNEKSNQKVDTLIRQSDSELTDPKNEYVKYMNQTLLNLKQLILIVLTEIKNSIIYDIIRE